MRETKPQLYEIKGDVTVLTIVRRNGDKIYVQFNTIHYPVVSKHRWSITTTGGYIHDPNSRPHCMLSRLVTACPPDLDVDHIDGDHMNNLDSNLRCCTVSQNLMNSGARKRGTSGYKCVSFHRRTGKWQAAYRLNKKDVYIGLFNTPEEAHEAYCAAVKDLHGEFFNPGSKT